MAVELSNVIPPPPRMTGNSEQDVVAIIQWFQSLYTNGILSHGLLQTANVGTVFSQQYPSLQSLSAIPGAANQFPIFTGPEVFSSAPISAIGLALVAASTQAAARTAIGAGIVQAVGGTAPIASSGGPNPIISITQPWANPQFSGTLQAVAATFTGSVTIAAGQDLQLGRAYVAGVVVTTGTIAIKDSAGTTYQVLVKL